LRRERARVLAGLVVLDDGKRLFKRAEVADVSAAALHDVLI